MEFEEEDFTVSKSIGESNISKENISDDWIVEKILGIRMEKKKVRFYTILKIIY